jgi:hypothetical protein
MTKTPNRRIYGTKEGTEVQTEGIGNLLNEIVQKIPQI